MEPLEESQTNLPLSHDGSKQPGAKTSSQDDTQATGVSDAKIADLTFKQASTELEGIVRALEAGDLELEQSLVAYRRGVELVKNLSERLEKAEQEVSTLTAEIFPAEDGQ